MADESEPVTRIEVTELSSPPGILDPDLYIEWLARLRLGLDRPIRELDRLVSEGKNGSPELLGPGEQIAREWGVYGPSFESYVPQGPYASDQARRWRGFIEDIVEALPDPR